VCISYDISKIKNLWKEKYLQKRKWRRGGLPESQQKPVAGSDRSLDSDAPEHILLCHGDGRCGLNWIFVARILLSSCSCEPVRQHFCLLPILLMSCSDRRFHWFKCCCQLSWALVGQYWWPTFISWHTMVRWWWWGSRAGLMASSSDNDLTIEVISSASMKLARCYIKGNTFMAKLTIGFCLLLTLC
jgi:hypothetical protein